MLRIWLLVFSLLVPATVVQATQGDSNPTPPVEVILEEVKPLRLVKFVYELDVGETETIIGLEGELRVKLTNKGKSTLELWDPEVHGLSFREQRTGERHVVVHPCQCVKDTTRPKMLTLRPGQTRTLKLDEWACSSIWGAPPPGRYKLIFQLLSKKDAARLMGEKTAGRKRPQQQVGNCREQFKSTGFWKGALSSEALDITLRKPKKKRKF